jgi:hypothetical protein
MKPVDRLLPVRSDGGCHRWPADNFSLVVIKALDNDVEAAVTAEAPEPAKVFFPSWLARGDRVSANRLHGLRGVILHISQTRALAGCAAQPGEAWRRMVWTGGSFGETEGLFEGVLGIIRNTSEGDEWPVPTQQQLAQGTGI